MREMKIGKQTERYEDGGVREITYSILVDTVAVEPGALELEYYGVGVADGEQSRQILGITFDADRIQWIADAMVQHTVTPGGLEDALEVLLEWSLMTAPHVG